MGVGVDSGWVTHWQVALGVGKPTRARYFGVIGFTSDDCHTWHRHVLESRGMGMETFMHDINHSMYALCIVWNVDVGYAIACAF